MKEQPRAQVESFTGELERLGPDGTDIMVLGVEAAGFEELSLAQKLLAYYLYRATIPGNKIAYHQCHRHAYEIKYMLEQIHTHSDGMDEDLALAVHDYLKYVWIHHGQYDHYTHTKFVPNHLDATALRAACNHAIARGARIPMDRSETAEAMLARLERSIFDADYEPIQTNQSEGTDIVATSAINYWDKGVTLDEIESLDSVWQTKVNARFAKRNGQVVPEEYKVGGVYGEELEVICHFLENALLWTETEEQHKSLESLIAYYHNGNEELFRNHCVHWLKSDSDIDYVNGFIEVYLDPRGVIGQFGANVSFKADAGIIDKISENAEYFEKRMPWPDKYKRTEITRPVANLVNVLIETGDSGPVSPAAYNLPNYNDIRRDHGSKNVILHNVESTWSRELLEETTNAFFLPEYRDLVIKYSRTTVRPLEVYMHEIIGHGSGQPDTKLADDPRAALGRVYSALEECRADLVALYHIADPKLIEVGAFSLAQQRDIVRTTYISYLQGWFARINRVPGLEVREAHNKGHHCILNYLLEGGESGDDFGVGMVQVDGDYYVRVTDLEHVRTGIGELLAKIQIIKSTGDMTQAEVLFDRFGTRLNPDWKANVVERMNRLKTPKAKAFVFPRLTTVVEDGEIVDIRLLHDEDLTKQQLRLSRLELSRELD